MLDEKPNKYERQESLPIPSYEEATTSRPTSSRSFLGIAEISHDAERQDLLGTARHDDRIRPRPQQNGYAAPTVESARSSLDFLPSSGGNSPRSSTDGLRTEMLRMEVLDPRVEGHSGRLSQTGNLLTKRISSLTHSLSAINLPFRQWLPSIDYVRAHMPNVPEQFIPGWIMVVRFFAFFLVLSLAYVLFLSDVFTISHRGGIGQVYDPESVRMYVQDHVDKSYIRKNLEHLTAFDHIAGTEGSYVLAKWVESLFHAAGLENTGLERFDVYLNYPKEGGRRVAITEPAEKAWEAMIEEEPAYTDPPRLQTMVFHGHSRSGDVRGPLVYANYGSREDFKKLENSGVEMKGKIALVRYYGSQGDRALKVKAAELAGCSGCIIYSDPADDGFRKGKTWPDGRFMPSTGVQRGAVSLMSWVVGDVLSPGFASLPGERKRVSKDNNPGLNNIPSIPLAWRDAQKLLQAIKGHGEKVPEDWVGGVPDVDEWWTGDQNSPIVHLKNNQDEVERQPIYNVLGKITGFEQPDKSIIVGNHRDAWCFGAADPGSGTAVFLEVVRIFGELKERGWRPMRTIEFASWDGEEYNLIGSTEHVEARMEDLRRNGFAYLNVDVGVVGDKFEAAACPLFEQALLRVLDRTSDPVQNRTLRSLWDEQKSTLQGLGAGSDYVAFQDMAGVSSIDMSFRGPPYPYHSCYDNFEWMKAYGDPNFDYHKTIAQIWALLILEMADRPVLPLNFEDYSRAVKSYVSDLESYADSMDAPWKSLEANTIFDLRSLNAAADEFVANAKEFHDWDRAWAAEVYGSGGFESNIVAIKRISHNTRMANFETNLLDVDGGLPGREQFKHVIFAPQAWSGYDEAYFPGIRDAIDNGDWELAQKQAEKVAGILSYASKKLNH
ncbi:MAG: glutamate carboxypeptidase Tre2 [Lasallia pustulata]|uniref:Glutamate carboxypeptidase Tre2 n=1 Tax=Lasallia pustulata TaxID=136370 RepID=A0A5M8Q1Z2_9LECA|nr:MAG: glutamate carboxypeptidase Tre2 [Lasallia pustulata]